MEDKKENTEQIILKAAEDEFLEKGFAGAKTTEIARRAGLTHAMLHYYFRTKENLFNVVFQNKLNKLTQSFVSANDSNIDFFEKLEKFIGNHFDFVASNPNIVTFVYQEIISNEKNRDLFIKTLLPRMKPSIIKLSDMINDEVKKGTIISIKPVDLLLNAVSVNLVTFMALPILNSMEFLDIDEFLKGRKENNIRFIINALKK